MKSDRASRHLPFHELVEAIAQPGCPFCRIAARSVVRALDALSFERVNDPRTQEEFRQALGFCARHAWQWLEMPTSAQGAAILYRAAIRFALERLERAERNGADPAGGFLSQVLKSRAKEAPAEVAALTAAAACSACHSRDQAQGRAIGVLLERLLDPDVRLGYEQSDGLCLPHLRLALARATARQREAAGLLLAEAVKRLGALDAELSEYIRKHDYRFQDEPYGEERSSPQRTVARFVGEPGVW